MARSINNTPLEEDEMKAFHQWLQINGIPHTHIPTEIGGSTPAMKARALKMKKMGTSKGFPDLLVFIPIYGNTDEPDAYQPLAIEMKRQKGSTTSKEQKEWLKILEMAGIPSAVCKGAEKAIEFVEQTIREIGGEE